MNRPRVSFVVPSYQQAPFLRRCLESCLAQDVKNAEIIVVDGGSTDGSQEVLASFGDRVRWTSEPDGGQADAVNTGVSRASGEVVAWINSDDAYAGPDAVSRALDAFEPGVDVVYGDALLVDAGGLPIRRYVTREFVGARDVLVAPQGPSQPATFFRRELFLACGGLRRDLRFALDYELWLRLFDGARRVARLHEVLAHMTAHRGAKSVRSMREHVAETARVKREAAARLGFGLLDRARLELGIAALHGYHAAVRLGLRRAV